MRRKKRVLNNKYNHENVLMRKGSADECTPFF